MEHSTLVTSSAGPNPNQVGAGAELGLATVRTLDAMYRSAKAGRAEDAEIVEEHAVPSLRPS